ncbi:MAG: NADH-quinone oxidoreductase subunit NuoN [Dehalococcoidia bacterium]|nr:NADH-quinone oxidoreductase subunit NuoN [Dehalococcoidia bacterium]
MSATEHLHHIGPALVLLIGSGVVFSADLVTPRRASLWGLTLVALVGGFLYALWHATSGTSGEALSGAVVVDEFGLFFAFVIIIATFAVVVASRDWADGREQAAEFYALILVSAGSMVLLAQSNDLITIFVALETTSIAQFVLAGIARDNRGAEASLKYLLTGAVSAAILLYGFAFLFGIAGTTSLAGIADFVGTADEGTRLPLMLGFVLVAAGFGFKMALVPFHGWVPDVYQGAPTPVVSFLSVASKAAGFAIVLRVFYTGLGGGGTFISDDWAVMFGVLAAASMVFGNAGALLQTDVKRLLGYSSIAQAGNIGIGLAAVAAGSTIGPAGVLFFIGTYVATNLGAFIAVIAASQRLGSDEIADYAGLIRRSPLIAVILIVCLLSLTGIPPTAGFIAKLYIFNGAIQAGETWLVGLVAVGVVNTGVSAYYYLRWMRTIVMDEPLEAWTFRPAVATQGVMMAAGLAVLVIGLMPTPLISAAQRAAAVLQ